MEITRDKLIEILEFNGFDCKKESSTQYNFIKNNYKVKVQGTNVTIGYISAWGFTQIDLENPNLIKHLELELGELKMPPNKAYYNIYELVEREHFHRCESCDKCCVLEFDEKVYCLLDSDVRVYYTKHKKFLNRVLNDTDLNIYKWLWKNILLWTHNKLDSSIVVCINSNNTPKFHFVITVKDDKNELRHYICEYVKE